MKRQKVMIMIIDKDGAVTRQERLETEAEMQKRIKDNEQHEKSKEYYQSNTEELICEICNGSMGKVYAGDLEGSHFYHSSCVK